MHSNDCYEFGCTLSCSSAVAFVRQTGLSGGFVQQSLTSVDQQSVAKFMATIVMNLVTPKSDAKQELLFNKPASWPSPIKLHGIVIYRKLTDFVVS
jgi:hypothetical protein